MDVSDFLLGGYQHLYKARTTSVLAEDTKGTRRDIHKNLQKTHRRDMAFLKRNIRDNLTPINTPEPKNLRKSVVKPKAPEAPEVSEELKQQLEKLSKWKETRQKLKQLQRQNSKPLFKVCHVQTNVGLQNLDNVYKEIKGKQIKKNTVKATPQSKFAPKNHVFHPPKSVKPIEFSFSTKTNKQPTPRTTRATKPKVEATKKVQENTKKVQESTKKVKETSKKEVQHHTMVTRNQKKMSVVNNKMEEAPAKKLSVKIASTTEAKTQKSKVTKPATPHVSKVEKKTRKKSEKVEQEDSTAKVEENEDKNQEDSKQTVVEPENAEKIPEIVLKTPVKQANLDGLADKTPIYISPFVTISRGKNRARQEFQIRNSVGKSTLASPEFDKDLTKHTSPQDGADFFSTKLQIEITRLESKATEWSDYKSSNSVPEEATDMIDVAIGQCRLLIAKKFKQFEGLIEECRTSEFTEKPVTCKDLHGFWDMIYMQVEDLDKRFDNLAKIRDNDWQEILPVVAKPQKKRVGRPVKTQASSKLKDLIKARRANNNKNEEKMDDLKVFDGGYFSVMSPIKVMSPGQPKSARKSLHDNIIDKEAKLRLSTNSLAIMNLSSAIKMGDGITPIKSILKTDNSKSAARSCKSVLFEEAHSVNGFDYTNKENYDGFVETQTPLRASLRRSSRLCKFTP